MPFRERLARLEIIPRGEDFFTCCERVLFLELCRVVEIGSTVDPMPPRQLRRLLGRVDQVADTGRYEPLHVEIHRVDSAFEGLRKLMPPIDN